MKKLMNQIRNGSYSTLNLSGCSAVLILSVIAYFTLLRPTLSARSELAANSVASMTAQQHLSTLQSAIHALEADVEQKNDVILKRSTQLLGPGKLNTRLSNIASLCNNCGLTTDEVQPGDAARASRFTVVPIHLAGHGNYRNIASFIHRLHAECGDVTVYTFKLLATPQPVNSQCSFEFDLRWLAGTESTPASVPAVITAELR